MSEKNNGEIAKPSLRRRLLSSTWIHVILAMLVMALIHGYVVKPYEVPSGSMERTLQAGDRIYVQRHLDPEPQLRSGDLVVFNATAAWGHERTASGVRWVAGLVGDFFGVGPSNHKALVKRIIGTPGDTVSCCSSKGAVQVNGDSLSEPYVYDDLPFVPGTLDCETKVRSARCFAPIRVEKKSYLVLGDHRAKSNDSVLACRGAPALPQLGNRTCTKFVGQEDVVGKVIFRAWPLSSIRGF